MIQDHNFTIPNPTIQNQDILGPSFLGQKYQKVNGFDLKTHIPFTNRLSWVEKYWSHPLGNSKNIILVQQTCVLLLSKIFTEHMPLNSVNVRRKLYCTNGKSSVGIQKRFMFYGKYHVQCSYCGCTWRITKSLFRAVGSHTNIQIVYSWISVLQFSVTTTITGIAFWHYIKLPLILLAGRQEKWYCWCI